MMLVRLAINDLDNLSMVAVDEHTARAQTLIPPQNTLSTTADRSSHSPGRLSLLRSPCDHAFGAGIEPLGHPVQATDQLLSHHIIPMYSQQASLSSCCSNASNQLS